MSAELGSDIKDAIKKAAEGTNQAITAIQSKVTEGEKQFIKRV